MTDEFREIYNAVITAGYTPRSYSGRGMMGRYCLGISLDSASELWPLAMELTKSCHWSAVTVPDALHRSPNTDTLGLGIVAYWPNIAWEEEEDEEDDVTVGNDDFEDDDILAFTGESFITRADVKKGDA